ncbi:stress-inducible protein [Streptomyces sp. NRRL F-4489]|uniref:universal stress protein n=1 Tax=Streptomyces sp. NRRL F-4489 TaxID=1609095 RepID=UPI0007489EBF|nr:universal stress protein [Streptomyces sp. NRRL F-4489]KUL34838.1 stress-inducible protein [Streptomyces sp. NRRL F-4489]
MEPEIITAGLDGSAESLAAAHWAADEADRRGAVLRLLHAWIMLAAQAPDTAPERDQNVCAREVVRAASAAVRARHPHLRIVEDLVGDEPEPALLRAAAESRLLVLGSRALSAWESFVLGDVGLSVVGRAEGPVVLVRAGGGPGEAERAGPGGPTAPGRPLPPDASGPRVVAAVGLGGPCDRLLAFAFEEAAGRGVLLQAVHGRPFPVHVFTPWGADPDASAEVTAAAEAELRDALRPWRERFPGVPVQPTVVHDSAARAVVQAAGGAGLLVVGRRRHRRLPGAPRVGPVAHAAIHHVTCPVAIVPHD